MVKVGAVWQRKEKPGQLELLRELARAERPFHVDPKLLHHEAAKAHQQLLAGTSRVDKSLKELLVKIAVDKLKHACAVGDQLFQNFWVLLLLASKPLPVCKHQRKQRRGDVVVPPTARTLQYTLQFRCWFANLVVQHFCKTLNGADQSLKVLD